ncbi:MAG: hypothetical protein H0T46_24620 [Deltaproteobacteria bacterium]|nr:hypothetical protein [Deltaproteobacteria bacterium]
MPSKNHQGLNQNREGAQNLEQEREREKQKQGPDNHRPPLGKEEAKQDKPDDDQTK